MGVLSIVFAIVHLANGGVHLRPSYFLSFFPFALMVVIVVGGILRRYVRARVVKDH